MAGPAFARRLSAPGTYAFFASSAKNNLGGRLGKAGMGRRLGEMFWIPELQVSTSVDVSYNAELGPPEEGGPVFCQGVVL